MESMYLVGVRWIEGVSGSVAEVRLVGMPLK